MRKNWQRTSGKGGKSLKKAPTVMPDDPRGADRSGTELRVMRTTNG